MRTAVNLASAAIVRREFKLVAANKCAAEGKHDYCVFEVIPA